MLIMLAVPVLSAVTRMHEYLQAFAPTNILARRARCSAPTWEKLVGLPALALVLVAATRGLAVAIADGASPWLNLIVLVLSWDTIKVACIAIGVEVRSLAKVFRRATRDESLLTPERRDRRQSMLC